MIAGVAVAGIFVFALLAGLWIFLLRWRSLKKEKCTSKISPSKEWPEEPIEVHGSHLTLELPAQHLHEIGYDRRRSELP